MKISGFFYHSDFTWNQCWGFYKWKICLFNTSKSSEFWFFMNFCTLLFQIHNIRAPKMAKMAILETLDSKKKISRKIWMTVKSWNFHTVSCRLLLWHFTKRQILSGVSTFWGKASIDRRSCVLSTFSSWIVNCWKFLFYFLFWNEVCFENVCL